ncbi:hypothetical protein LTR99_007101 [Exophiala xenobiotica]|uniref:Uncharacterized protein n=1 Tax=Vermiconidia calcicola TaxID=1690605 RepID=A0AAV9PVN1_9PEZI|nr:hypothetical protein LTR92_006920 [Exophiala xenobiotica]KAK5528893.1 hypothetical protein LTR25_010078 [Vermiconidia calcicola]KAK5544939.1 hypothetical protein LTR23_004068 [Chaetothyriales sp. CCFEE 6169]KAK5221077.1 hypothetical protein LTR72_006635 [Exophiala xenobiotica]KAK5269665.1 hypothetical protein LTR96_005363 [Exophiala xenobiotica]
MIDNLQRWYLQRLQAAGEFVLHGNVQDCVSICLEMLLKTDLALWTRALVNLLLADVAPIEHHPDKAKYAIEALRLIQELQEEDHPGKNAFWLTEYADAEQRARACLIDVRRQEEQYAASFEERDVTTGMEGLELANESIQNDNAELGVEDIDTEEWVEIGNDGDIPLVEEPLGIEGYFTLNPAMAGTRIVINEEILLKQPADAAEAVDIQEDVQEEVQEDDEDMLLDLPNISEKAMKSSKKGFKSSLLTPPPSSDPAQNEREL